MKKAKTIRQRLTPKTIAIIATSTVGAFFIGIQTAGDFQPVISPTQADTAAVLGDFNGNGKLDEDDAQIAVSLAAGQRSPKPEELAVDPDQDFAITNKDAMYILEELKKMPAGEQTKVEL